jgi:hypothetical protein
MAEWYSGGWGVLSAPENLAGLGVRMGSLIPDVLGIQDERGTLAGRVRSAGIAWTWRAGITLQAAGFPWFHP